MSGASIDSAGSAILLSLVVVFLLFFDIALVTAWVRRWFADSKKQTLAKSGITLCLLLIGCGILWDQITHYSGWLVVLICALPVVRIGVCLLFRKKDRDTEICSLMLALAMVGTLGGVWCVFTFTEPGQSKLPDSIDSISCEAHSEVQQLDSDSGLHFATILYEEPGSFDFFRRGTVLTKDQTKYVREYFEKQKRNDLDVFFTTRSDGRLVRR